MPRAGLAALFFVIIICPREALAVDPCQSLAGAPLAEYATMANRLSPVKYYEMANGIRLVSSDIGDSLMPQAGVQQGKPYISIPTLFPGFACKLSFTFFLLSDGAPSEDFTDAVTAAAKCRELGGTPRKCLGAFADTIWAKYHSRFEALEEGKKFAARKIYLQMRDQVMMHEYAHHFLGHFAHGVSRPAAEFDADLFAVTNGVQDGEVVTALQYLLNPLASIDKLTTRATSSQYESSACRLGNVQAIARSIGPAASMVVLDATMGSDHQLEKNSPSFMRRIVQEEFPASFTELDGNVPGCSRINIPALKMTHEELRRLYLRMAKEADYLFARRTPSNTEHISRLIRDLVEMERDFKYVNGLGASVIARLAQYWGIIGKGSLLVLEEQFDQMLTRQPVRDNFLSCDYGRLLAVQATTVLRMRQDIQPELRVARGALLFKQSVYYNPALSDSWLNLVFLSFKRGDCREAAVLALKGANGVEDDTAKKFFILEADHYAKLAQKPEECRRQAAAFHLGGLPKSF